MKGKPYILVNGTLYPMVDVKTGKDDDGKTFINVKMTVVDEEVKRAMEEVEKIRKLDGEKYEWTLILMPLRKVKE